MRIACWIRKATNTHAHVVLYLLLFHCNNGCKNAPQCYVIRTMPVLLFVDGFGFKVGAIHNYFYADESSKITVFCDLTLCDLVPKIYTKLHNVTFHVSLILIVITLRTSNLSQTNIFYPFGKIPWKGEHSVRMTPKITTKMRVNTGIRVPRGKQVISVRTSERMRIHVNHSYKHRGS